VKADRRRGHGGWQLSLNGTKCHLANTRAANPMCASRRVGTPARFLIDVSLPTNALQPARPQRPASSAYWRFVAHFSPCSNRRATVRRPRGPPRRTRRARERASVRCSHYYRVQCEPASFDRDRRRSSASGTRLTVQPSCETRLIRPATTRERATASSRPAHGTRSA
jgi:hypothetical protein